MSQSQTKIHRLETPIRIDKEVINWIGATSPFFPIDNFYPDAICAYKGLMYQNSEAAFQSAKLLKRKDRIPFTTMSPAEAKIVGKTPHLTPLRPDWNEIRAKVMYDVVLSKMLSNPWIVDDFLLKREMQLSLKVHGGMTGYGGLTFALGKARIS